MSSSASLIITNSVLGVLMCVCTHMHADTQFRRVEESNPERFLSLKG